VRARDGVEPMVLDGVGHHVMLEQPERFNAVLTSTLSSFEGSTS
jgi:pimeloyl-ACP methyl ester carboxylesterase